MDYMLQPCKQLAVSTSFHFACKQPTSQNSNFLWSSFKASSTRSGRVIAFKGKTCLRLIVWWVCVGYFFVSVRWGEFQLDMLPPLHLHPSPTHYSPTSTTTEPQWSPEGCRLEGRKLGLPLLSSFSPVAVPPLLPPQTSVRSPPPTSPSCSSSSPE